MHVYKWLYEEWKVCTQITVTQQTQITVRHLPILRNLLNDCGSRKVFTNTVCVLLTMSGFRQDCETIYFVRPKELFLSRSFHTMQVLHPNILNFISFERHTD